MLDNLLFVAFPYVSLILFIGGSIYRAFGGFMGARRGTWDWSARGDYYWTTRSTGFFGRASIGPAALSLHWGIILLFVAHIVGFIGGAFALTTWVEVFRWLGLASGLLVLYGVVWAFVRRITIPQVKAMSQTEDYIVLLFLIVIAGLGLYQSAVELVFGISYSVGPWIGGIFKLEPDPSMMAGIPLVNKLHVLVAIAFFAYFPFTKLVHVFSFPFAYASRAYISMRTIAGLKR